MVLETSKRITQDVEVLETIVRLSSRQDFAALRDELERMRDAWSENFMRGALKSRLPFDQREVDEKRGFWDGIDFAMNRLPAQAQASLKRLLTEDSKESE